ncbi:MAG: hypothetical protein EBZ49_12645, partial [Proteobacteria bacterium]|nr:hypothetical protein [Pseudomonadota bacterium]
MSYLLTFQFLFSIVSWAQSITELTSLEKHEVTNRLEQIYKFPHHPQALELIGKKVNSASGEPVFPHPELKKYGPIEQDPLMKQAQIKATEKYRNWYCTKVLKRIWLGFSCSGFQSWASVENEDRVADLADTWVDKLTYDLSDIPTRGESLRPLWSDDFWPMVWGLTSYRYSQAQAFNSYREAITSYAQPSEWLKLLLNPIEELNTQVVDWSPSEKYDLTVQDEQFSLTQEQKEEGDWYRSTEGEVEGWMGLCHGWAPASIMVERPELPVTVPGTKDSSVLWYPNDIKAMITLAWANGSWDSNFIGRRCEQKKIKRFPNGRISSQDCFDTNPATFHLALGNLVGKEKASFIMDNAYDYQVWNQPVVAYEFTYFNPFDRSKQSKDWQKVAVVYDKHFKKKDRFQKPLTRGSHLEGPSDPVTRLRRNHRPDEHIKKVVGVIASVIYLVETSPPEHGPSPGTDLKVRDVYLYDLELANEDGVWMATG